MKHLHEQEINEEQLLELSKKYQDLIKEFETKTKNNLQIILLVGLTGCGKSTLFNFLTGAQFQLLEHQKDHFNVPTLTVKQMIDGNSIIKREGKNSVIQQQEPKYYFNNSLNHLLIDFPGFQFTNRSIDLLIVQLIFYKIVCKSPIKIVYIIRHPESSMYNRDNLQQFLKTQFQLKDSSKFKFIFVLNSYNDDLPEEKLIQYFKYLQLRITEAKACENENIFVIKKIKNEDTLSTEFSEQKRNQLWQDVTKSSGVRINPIILPYSSIFTEYLGQSCQKIFDDIKNLFQIYIKRIAALNIQQLWILYSGFNIMRHISKQKNNRIEQLQKFYEQCNQLSNSLGIENQKLVLNSTFIELYLFFYQFSDLIEGFIECEEQFIQFFSDFSYTQKLTQILMEQTLDNMSINDENAINFQIAQLSRGIRKRRIRRRR